MGVERHPSTISKKGYAVFIAECSQHLTRLDPMMISPESALEVEEIKKASNAFHTIKGGAGFFGLREVEGYAGDLEALLGRADLNLDEARQEIEKLFNALKGALTKLPPPI